MAEQQIIQLDLFDYVNDIEFLKRYARRYEQSNKFSDFNEPESTNFDKSSYKFLWDTAEDVIADNYNDDYQFVIVVKMYDVSRLQKFFYDNFWLFCEEIKSE